MRLDDSHHPGTVLAGRSFRDAHDPGHQDDGRTYDSMIVCALIRVALLVAQEFISASRRSAPLEPTRHLFPCVATMPSIVLFSGCVPCRLPIALRWLSLAAAIVGRSRDALERSNRIVHRRCNKCMRRFRMHSMGCRGLVVFLSSMQVVRRRCLGRSR